MAEFRGRKEAGKKVVLVRKDHSVEFKPGGDWIGLGPHGLPGARVGLGSFFDKG